MGHEQVTLTMAGRARDGLATFASTQRENGPHVRLRDDAPQWLSDLVFQAHQPATMLPDDWRFRFTRDALRQIAHADPDDTQDKLVDKILPDVHHHELVSWLGSDVIRQGYCDEAQAEQGQFNTQAELLAAGQARERQIVFSVVWDALASMDR
jgi:hypothetical protein